jgi:CBS domain-containing protein
MARVGDVMTRDPRTVSLGDSLAGAARIMKEEDVGSLPVVDADGRLVGILTDRDIVVRVVAEAVDAQAAKVGDAASRDLVTASAQDDLVEALEVMARHRVRRLPIVDDGRLVGVIAQADVALEAPEGQAGGMLEQISQPDPTQSKE